MARKGENIYKRKDGRYEGRYILSYNESGKAKYAYVYDKTYSGVKEKLFQAKSQNITSGSNNSRSASIIKYEYWLSEWLNKKKISVKDSTYIRYRNTVDNHIVPLLGKYPINKISTSLMEQYVQKKMTCGRIDGNGGISPKMMSDIMVIIKETFKYAQNCGVTTVCNFSGINIRNNSQIMRVLSNSEEKRLMSVLQSDTDLYKLGVYICLFTGIRLGELCALQWKNISFPDKTLKVTQTMQRLQCTDKGTSHKTQIILTEPKSYAAARTIPIPEFLTEMMFPFASSPNAFVLSNECNKYVEPRTMQNRFKKYLAEGHILDANFHSLRHTFATRCVEIGFDIKTLSEILGHSNVKITLDKYVHSSLKLKRSYMDKLQYVLTDK